MCYLNVQYSLFSKSDPQKNMIFFYVSWSLKRFFCCCLAVSSLFSNSNYVKRKSSGWTENVGKYKAGYACEFS